MKSLREIARKGGYGDQIMASVCPDRPGYLINSTKERDTFNLDFRVIPGKVEVKHAQWAADNAPRDMILVHPHIKGRHSADNKDWGWDKWQELVRHRRFLQCVPPGKKTLKGVVSVVTPTIDHVVSVLAQSRGIVTTEGGLHHAAGALRKPAVVIFGAFNLPSMFGYEFHINLAEPDPEGLGQRKSHPACRAAMNRITVQRVLDAIEEMFGAP